MITQPIRFCIALLATAITVLGMLGPTRTLAGECSADVVFLMDNTGSMQATITDTQTNANTILNAISGGDDRFEGVDAQYAVATYWGDPLEYGGIGSTWVPPGCWGCSGGKTSASGDELWRKDKYHCPTAKEYGGKTNDFTVSTTGEYWVDLIDTWGDGWSRYVYGYPAPSNAGNQLTFKRGSTALPFTTGTNSLLYTGPSFFDGAYASGGKVSLEKDTTYKGEITPYSPYGGEMRWRICPVGKTIEPAGFQAIARRAFKVNQSMTDSKSAIQNGMAEWVASSRPGGYGHDWPEGNYFALHQLATEGAITDGKCEPGYTGDCTDVGYKTNYPVGWRKGAGKVIVLFGDAPSHCSTVSFNEALAALKTKNIVVAAINTQTPGWGIDYYHRSKTWYPASTCDGSSPTAGQATAIKTMTKGTLTNDVVGGSTTVKAILDAVSQGVAQSGSAAAISFSSAQLETSTHLYQSYFDAKYWSGDVKAFQMNITNGQGKIGSQVWSAAEKLNARTPDSRVILTMGKEGDTETSADVPVPFRWDSLTATQQRDLRTEHGKTTEETESKGRARLAYLRGDRSNEGLTGLKFRARLSVLGDIWHSETIYYAKPSLDWPDSDIFGKGALYSDFRENNANRDGVVYVGSNDGMLHAFAADTGEEILAYVPGNLYSSTIYGGYHQLTDPNFEHTSIYVDGTPYVADAYIRTRNIASKSWRTVLIGTEGDGGRGLFALDVTNPSGFSESTPKNIVLWEFNNADDAHLGKTFSRPTVALLNNGRWAVITGNGPEDTAVDSSAGDAQLFIIYLDGAFDGSWTKGEDYLRITTTVGKQTDRNGLFTPALVDLDNNGTADRAYAGDLKGRMWAFDLSSSNPTDWAIAHKNKKPLFKGKKNQPITTQPEVIRHPTVDFSEDGSAPHLMVLFGTGQFLRTADNTLQHKQSYYGVWDRGFNEGNLRRNDLMPQKFMVDDVSSRKRALNPNLVPNWHKEKGLRQYGWYIDLTGKGERVAARSLVRHDGILHFNTIIPDTSICATGGGTGWEMAVETSNGGSPLIAMFDFDDDGVIRGLEDEWAVPKDPDDTSDIPDTVGYAGRMLEADKGMPSGPSIIGDMKFTPTVSTVKGEEPAGTTKLRESTVSAKFLEGGRYSWQHMTHPQ